MPSSKTDAKVSAAAQSARWLPSAPPVDASSSSSSTASPTVSHFLMGWWIRPFPTYYGFLRESLTSRGSARASSHPRDVSVKERAAALERHGIDFAAKRRRCARTSILPLCFIAVLISFRRHERHGLNLTLLFPRRIFIFSRRRCWSPPSNRRCCLSRSTCPAPIRSTKEKRCGKNREWPIRRGTCGPPFLDGKHS